MMDSKGCNSVVTQHHNHDSSDLMAKNALEMREVLEPQEILKLLLDFKHIFPRLDSRVENFEAFAEKFAKFAHVYAGNMDGKTCGFLAFYANDFLTKVAFISLIGMLEGYRGKRLGQQLMDFCQKCARDVGMTILRLEVDLDNYTAIAFYEKNGFVQYGEKMEKSMYMEKSLI